MWMILRQGGTWSLAPCWAWQQNAGPRKHMISCFSCERWIKKKNTPSIWDSSSNFQLNFHLSFLPAKSVQQQWEVTNRARQLICCISLVWSMRTHTRMQEPSSTGTWLSTVYLWSDHHGSFLVCSSLISPSLCTSRLELRMQAAPCVCTEINPAKSGTTFCISSFKIHPLGRLPGQLCKRKASVEISALQRSDGVWMSPQLTWVGDHCNSCSAP